MNNFETRINFLTKYHYNKSKHYKKILNFLNIDFDNLNLKNVPFLPTKLFKEVDLLSVNKNKIIKTLTSSGTTGQKLSKIYLDKKNSRDQILALRAILSKILSNQRLPMLIVEPNLIYDKNKFNASRAAITGFSLFGTNHTYILDNDGNIEIEKVKNFLKNFGKDKFIIFGFTYKIFTSLIKSKSLPIKEFNLKNAILLHGGGWKKLEQFSINNQKFKDLLFKRYKLKKVFNYYGMVEQTGSIFLECEKCGLLECSSFSQVLIRDKNYNIVSDGTKGIIQLLSILPTSYPGHSILSEDIGIIKPKKKFCDSKFIHFEVLGRIQEAEIRGCSNI